MKKDHDEVILPRAPSNRKSKNTAKELISNQSSYDDTTNVEPSFRSLVERSIVAVRSRSNMDFLTKTLVGIKFQ